MAFRHPHHNGSDCGVTDLFVCPSCKKPFVAADKGLIARRDGNCATCTKAEFLRSIGLSPDFLDRLPGNP
jgi:hypothetical protein